MRRRRTPDLLRAHPGRQEPPAQRVSLHRDLCRLRPRPRCGASAHCRARTSGRLPGLRRLRQDLPYGCIGVYRSRRRVQLALQRLEMHRLRAVPHGLPRRLSGPASSGPEGVVGRQAHALGARAVVRLQTLRRQKRAARSRRFQPFVHKTAQGHDVILTTVTTTRMTHAWERAGT